MTSFDEMKKFMDEHEKKPQTIVPDNTPPVAQEPEDPPAEEEVEEDPADVETPSGDVDTDTPPDDSGDGTSDANDATEESSTSDNTADPEGENEDASSGQEETPPKKNSARERIQELVDERDSYRDYGTYAQDQIRAKDQRIQELEKSVKPEKVPAPAAIEEDPPIPTLEDPDIMYDPEKFTKKTQEWGNKVKENAVKRAAVSTSTTDPQAQRKKAEQEFIGRAQTFAGVHKDFESVTNLLPVFAPKANGVLVLTDVGPDMLYYLGKHKSEAIRIAKLPEDEQLLEFGSIRTKVRAEQAVNTGKKPVLPPKDTTPTQGASQTPAKPKSTSKAPPPLTPVRGGGRANARDITDPGMSMDEFVKRDRAEKIARRDASRQARGLR